MVLLFSCGATQKTPLKPKELVTTIEVINCPEDGSCNAQIIENQLPQLAYDEFDNSYLMFTESSTSHIKLEYTQIKDPKIMDAGYREELIIPFDNTMFYESQTIDLADLHVFFGRFCFCKGQTGYYLIKEGELKITKVSDEEYNLDMSFAITEVPQVLKQINLRIKQ